MKFKYQIGTLFACIALLIATNPEVVKAQTFYLLNPIQLFKELEEVTQVTEKIGQENHGVKNKQVRPLVQNIITDVAVNIYNLIQNPSLENFRAVAVDFNSYIVMPFQGGYYACFAHEKYYEDRLAYDDAGVSEEFLFIQASNMFKEKFWQFFGLFSRVTN